MNHPLGSPYVRDQLSLRATQLNSVRMQPDGEYVLYWMQSTQRLEDNWALRYATVEADRIGKPLVIYFALRADDRYASARSLTFALEGIRQVAVRSARLGLTFRVRVVPLADDDLRIVTRLASRAYEVVTDLFPTNGVAERSARAAERVGCRLVAVDSAGVIASASFHKEEFAARTIRPKMAKLLEHSLEGVEDRAPRKSASAALLESLDMDWLDVLRCDIAEVVASADVDHSVREVSTRGGLTHARGRLDEFIGDGLRDYAERRRHPSDQGGSSHLSPYLHAGTISPREVAMTVRNATDSATSDAFLNEMLTWRELSLNFCLRNDRHESIEALPDWVRRSMERHADDPRDVVYSLDELERSATHDDIWNAGQRELVETGQMHNVVRMLWGKSVLTWAPTYADAMAWLIHLNDKYALDGCDPNSYAGIQWCFGKFDRPFAERPVWGTIRPMSLVRARSKYDLDGYLSRWSAEPLLL